MLVPIFKLAIPVLTVIGATLLAYDWSVRERT